MIPAVAAFDFDSTITDRDTIWPFLEAVSGRRALAWRLPLALPVLGARAARVLGPTATKEHLFKIYLRGRPMSEVAAAASRFVHDVLPAFIRPAALARLRWHRARGDRCIVVTASPELYVGLWSAAEGLECLGSRLEVDAGGRLTGRHEGAVCDGAEKARRLRDVIGALDAELYAYGDSRGDRELLALARHAFFRDMPPPGQS